ncbi:hypothetical protein O1V64_20520 [Rouxiella badensis]|nr:hypothetical protein O1V64_20520 [Rouxiella badensis]
MSDFSIAAAQITCVAGNIDVNIQRHSRAVALAAEHGVSLIIFPELSLTGYESRVGAQARTDASGLASRTAAKSGKKS